MYKVLSSLEPEILLRVRCPPYTLKKFYQFFMLCSIMHLAFDSCMKNSWTLLYGPHLLLQNLVSLAGSPSEFSLPWNLLPFFLICFQLNQNWQIDGWWWCIRCINHELGVLKYFYYLKVDRKATLVKSANLFSSAQRVLTNPHLQSNNRSHVGFAEIHGLRFA